MNGKQEKQKMKWRLKTKQLSNTKGYDKYIGQSVIWKQFNLSADELHDNLSNENL